MWFYAIVGALLLNALARDGFKPPGTAAFRIANAVISAFLVLGYCSAIPRFWWSVKQPGAYEERNHVLNSLIPGITFYITSLSIVVGIITVFIGFALAHRKRRGIRGLFKMLPALVLSGMGSFMLGFLRRRNDISLSSLIPALLFAACIYCALYLWIRRFYIRNGSAELFQD